MSDLAAKIDPLPAHQSFEVSKYSDYFMLKFPDGRPFAQVSELVSRGLVNIQQYPSVEMRAFAETKRIQRVFSHAKKPGEATMTVEINMYGSVTDSDVIGEELSSAKLFLQDPTRGVQDIEYCNPHIVEFSGIEEPKPENLGRNLFVESSEPFKIVREERKKFDHTVSTIYQSLTRSRNLEGKKGGALVLTPLLP
jgi:SWI/SNF-related matrix-associated actin-dependent regulator of chromatin subfamily A3